MAVTHHDCVLWDIDGTLIKYEEPSANRFLDYLRQSKVRGRETTPELVGTTEAGIMAEYLDTNDIDTIRRHLRRMDGVWLADRTESARPIAAASRLLERLRHFARQTVVTGNTYLRAVTKISDAGMSFGALDLGVGAFGDERVDRAELVALAIRRCLASSPREDRWRFVYVGDTPIDGSAARAVGVPVLLVATGKYSVSELANVGYGHVASDLSAAELTIRSSFSAVPSVCL